MANRYGVQINFLASQVREATGPKMRTGSGFVKLFEELASLDKEAFFVVTLNQKNEVIDKYLISLGTLTGALVHPREVFKPAILDSAAAVAFVHNHPSGDPTPSSDDREITARLVEGGKLLGIRILDHVVIGRKSYFSFTEEGLM